MTEHVAAAEKMILLATKSAVPKTFDGDANMRVNVYQEELTDEIMFVRKRAETGGEFIGVRFYLLSAHELHDDSGDDDRSAVTFWSTSREQLEKLFSQAIGELGRH